MYIVRVQPYCLFQKSAKPALYLHYYRPNNQAAFGVSTGEALVAGGRQREEDHDQPLFLANETNDQEPSFGLPYCNDTFGAALLLLPLPFGASLCVSTAFPRDCHFHSLSIPKWTRLRAHKWRGNDNLRSADQRANCEAADCTSTVH